MIAIMWIRRRGLRAGRVDTWCWALAILMVSLPSAALGATDELAGRVVILANSADQNSLRIADHYAEARGVPSANIIALPMTVAETVSWPEFVRSIWNPLLDELVGQKWIDAMPMKPVDAVGRRKFVVAGHRISYLVVCRGVPLRIRHDVALNEAAPPMTDNPIFRTNAGSVDGELSLLTQPNHRIVAYLANPLYGNDRPSARERSHVVKVSRLDGPTAEDALRLVDRAMAAERTGLVGRAYVDLGGIHPDGERWLEHVAELLSELGFETEVDRAPTTFPESVSFDAPVFYFGWYAGTVNGPFTVPGFRFPNGAVALHIHSFSAATMRDPEAGWCGPFVARGVTATVGNVYEPYLQLTHRPDWLIRALVRGENFGDAVAYAQPALSWQTTAIGDPLYRPFAIPPRIQPGNSRVQKTK